jgi:hypothetical protein
MAGLLPQVHLTELLPVFWFRKFTGMGKYNIVVMAIGKKLVLLTSLFYHDVCNGTLLYNK